ncbi:MAG: alpha-amylase family glycosyl hydrolase [Pseudomonadota bacterium]
MTKDGFGLRFRVLQKDCPGIDRAEIIFRSDSNPPPNFPFYRVTPEEMTGWRKLYGPKEQDYCWFEARVSGLNLNQILKNQYILKIYDTTDSSPFYYTDLDTSILPSKRITQNPTNLPWFSLGQPGATLVEGGGVYFKIWEPIADEVHLFLNNATTPFKMAPDKEIPRDPKRCHVIYLPEARAGDIYFYKFLKSGKYEALPVGNFPDLSEVKIDPMGRKLTYDEKGGKWNGYVNPRSVVAEIPQYPWGNDSNIESINNSDQLNNWILYQLWPLAFNPQSTNGKYSVGTFSDTLKKVDYLKDLGVNAVEFMPVNETRFNAAWGYALDSLLLIEKGYGTPSNLMEVVDNLHKNNIRVVLDVIVNHVNNTLIRDPLSSSVDESKYFKGFTDWGPRPRFENAMVRKWISDSLLSLMRDYHVDGFRYDMVKYIYQGVPKGYEFLSELMALSKIENPNFYNFAEELPNNVWTTKPQSENGLGFDSQWNDLFKNFFEKEFDHYRSYNRNVNMIPLHSAMLGFSDHMDWGRPLPFGGPTRSLNYLGSHDFIGNRDPIIRIVSDYESFEADGHNTFYRVRPLTDPSQKRNDLFRLIHNNFTHSFGRLAYGILFTKPGGILFFQGEELANDLNIENEWSYVDAQYNNAFPSKNIDIDRYVSSHKMVWEYLNPTTDGPLSFLNDQERELFNGHRRFFKDMIEFRRNHPEINRQDAYNVRLSYDNSVMTYQIGNEENNFFVIANFGDLKASAWIPFPGESDGWWDEVTNSSHKKYGGTTDHYLNIISNLGGRTNNVRIDASTIIIFAKRKTPQLQQQLYLRADFNSWRADNNFKLAKRPDSEEVYTADFENPASGNREFKLATASWEIEMGSASAVNQLDAMSKGYLTYAPDGPNIRVNLKKGKYKFLFNIKTFEYTFLSVE